MIWVTYVLVGFGLYCHLADAHPESKWLVRVGMAVAWPFGVGMLLGELLDKPYPSREGAGQ